MFYAITLSESQRVMLGLLILEEFGPNIKHIAGVDNIIADMLSTFTSTSINKYKLRTSRAQCLPDELFTIIWVENIKDCFPLNLLVVQRQQQKYLRKINSKLSP